MKYVNPYEFLQLLIGEQLSDESTASILLARKKAFAELELSPTQTVTVKGDTYSKNDILKFFDELQGANNMPFHHLIAKDTVLLELLTTGNLRNNGKFKYEPAYKTPEFRQFISPWYEPVYTALVLRCIKELNTRTLTDIMMNVSLLDDAHKHLSYERIERPLRVKINRLKDIQDEMKTLAFGANGPGDIEANAGIYCVAVFNLLPEDFQQLRDDYAIAVINTAMAMQAIALRVAVEILNNVRQLKCNEYLKQQNEERYRLLSANLERQVAISNNSRGSGSIGGGAFKTGGSIVFVIIAIIRILLMISHCR